MKPMGKGLLRLLGGLFLLLLVGLAVAGIVQSGRIGDKSETAAAFAFDPYSENRFTLLDRGLLVTSDAGLSLFNESGKLLLSRTLGHAQPLTAARGGYAAVWSQESSQALVLSAQGDLLELNLSGSVMTAKVSEAGWSVILAKESGSKGAATVYKPDGQAVYRVRLGSSYPVDADLAPDNGSLALLTLQGAGSHLGVYSLSQEEELHGWIGEEEVFFELDWLGGNSLLLLGTDRAVFLDGQCQPVNIVEYQDMYLKDYAVTGEGYLILALGKYRSGNAARLITLDKEGRQLGSLELQGEAEGLSAAGRWIAVRYPDRVALYDLELQEKGSRENAAGAEAALVREDGSVILVAGGAATVVEP